jgi:hypothetical protein
MWDAELVRQLRIGRANLENYLRENPSVTFHDPEAKRLLFVYVAALGNRLWNLRIDPRSDPSYLEAEVLKWRTNTRELPHLRQKYLE